MMNGREVDLQEQLATQERLKAAVHYTVGKLCEYREPELKKRVSKYLMATLADLVYKQAEILATDIEAFAKHAKRSVISAEDVKLCGRRNSSLFEILNESANTRSDVDSHERTSQSVAKKRSTSLYNPRGKAARVQQHEILDTDDLSVRDQEYVIDEY